MAWGALDALPIVNLQYNALEGTMDVFVGMDGLEVVAIGHNMLT